MAPKPDSPIEPFKQAVRNTLHALVALLSKIRVSAGGLPSVVMLGLLMVHSHAIADECSGLPPKLQPIQVEFSRQVAMASDITLAKVTSQQNLNPPGVITSSSTASIRYTFQTIERVKGNAPDTFLLDGIWIDDIGKQKANARSDHNGLGKFWMYFPSTTCFTYPQGFSVGSTFLIFRKPDGHVVRSPVDYGAEIIPDANDKWLEAVRSLARNTDLKKGRSASLVDFLAAANSIAVVITDTCPSSSPKLHQRQRVAEHIWGTPLTEKLINSLGHIGQCVPNSSRLVIVPGGSWHNPDAALEFGIQGPDQLVDFSGFLAGTNNGLQSTQQFSDSDLWYSQVDLQGSQTSPVAEIKKQLATMPKKTTSGN